MQALYEYKVSRCDLMPHKQYKYRDLSGGFTRVPCVYLSIREMFDLVKAHVKICHIGTWHSIGDHNLYKSEKKTEKIMERKKLAL